MAERNITTNCEWCGEEFTYLYCGRGVHRRFCSEECIKNHNARKDGFGFTDSQYLKGDRNKLEVLMKDLEARGITYSEYKKQRALEQVGKVDINL